MLISTSIANLQSATMACRSAVGFWSEPFGRASYVVLRYDFLGNSMCKILLCSGSFFLALLAGCGHDGPVKYKISGEIQLPDGKPVPAGEISFEPDAATGNAGPGSMAQIKDGKYSLPRDQGVVGGDYSVIISPFDGVPFGESLQGKPLRPLPYTEKVKLPNQDSVKNFKIN
jgi:hypothetical protein